MTPTVAAHPEEKIPPGEAEDIAVITKISLEILDTSQRPVRRGQHPKQHGGVRADFIVGDDVPEDLKVGIFGHPRTYAAWVRFSNGSQDNDAKGDIHGMAIKLVGVEGDKILEDERDEQTQDFVLMDHPAFFSRDARSNRRLAEVMERSKHPSRLKTLLSWILRGRTGREVRSAYIALTNFVLGFRFHELKVLRAAVSKKPTSPLRIIYWSATPYGLGDRAVKYSARPLPSSVPAPTDMLSPDRLRAAMAAHLDKAEARFDFLVQVRTPPRNQAMPVEDSSIEWSETRAPFRKVATIVIPAQTFDTPDLMKFTENLSYTPWHALPLHRPIGGINRARKVVYEVISKKRHGLNMAPRAEPGPGNLPEAIAVGN